MLAVGVAIVAAIGLVLMFLLTQATGNREMYERNYARLFVLNVVVAVVLGGVILWAAWRLFKRLRQGRFGSRLLDGFPKVKAWTEALLATDMVTGSVHESFAQEFAANLQRRGFWAAGLFEARAAE